MPTEDKSKPESVCDSGALPSPDTSYVTGPPRTLVATLLRLGPGMIIAGSIVGSGELIATTKAGAEAGFLLLWLIIIGCVIKVSTQIELGRYTVTWGQTPLKALDSVPGPRLKVVLAACDSAGDIPAGRYPGRRRANAGDRQAADALWPALQRPA